MPDTLTLDKPLTLRQQQVTKLQKYSQPRPFTNKTDFALESFKAGIKFALTALEANCDG